ncbi:DUF6398 domain-containing protein [Armatimonas sp.]|uniref:DUF6398 domain-containing protein n=1 Tax=Armatimonas sp. TaxID=1872638 RepID=UPI00286BBC88|nr:DUF6398 domain-containing protein [Armatimonas sp.]
MARKTKQVDPRVVIAQNHLSGKIIAFCETYLNKECQKLCLKLLDTWAKHDPEALLRGKPEVSAAAVVHTIASLNDLFYKDSKPYVPATEIAYFFGVSVGGVNTRVNALKQTMQASNVPIVQYLTKKNKPHEEGLEGLLDQMMALMSQMKGETPLDGIASVDEEGNFYDAERSAMHEFYEVMNKSKNNSFPARLVSDLQVLIAKDPDFYDSYGALGDMIGGKPGRKLQKEACTRALGRIKSNSLIKNVSWSYLENRHLLRAILNEAIASWKELDTANAVSLFKYLLEICPDDNVGARHYLLAVREEMSFAGFEKTFMGRGGLGYDALMINTWFESNSLDYPKDFLEWQKHVDQYESQ